MQKDIKNISNEAYPKISIVTVCFNSAKTLEQTILSVINQTYSNIEYIIIDGESTDGTVEIIEKYQEKIAYWVSEPDGGIYDAMNKGIEKATGDYIYFIGSDDYLVDEKIMNVVAGYLKEDVSIDILSGGVWVVDEEYGIEKQAKNISSVGNVLIGEMIHHQGLFVRTNLLKEHNFDISYKIFADYDWLLKWSQVNDNLNRIKFINEPVAFYFLGGFGSTNKFIGMIEYNKIIFKNHYRVTYKIKSIMKNFDLFKITAVLLFKKFNLWKKISKNRGWKSHKCNNIGCRLCDK